MASIGIIRTLSFRVGELTVSELRKWLDDSDAGAQVFATSVDDLFTLTTEHKRNSGIVRPLNVLSRERKECPECRKVIVVNLSGRFMKHYSHGGHTCSGSHQIASE